MQRTLVEMRQEVERQLDAGARRIATRDGLDFHSAYSRFLTTAHGGELYRLYNELPAGALPQPEAEPVRFAESVGAAQAWDEIDRLARERRRDEHDCLPPSLCQEQGE